MTAPGIAGPILLSADDLAAVADRLAREISHDHPEGVTLVGLLKGSVCLLADVARRLEVPAAVDFLALAPYGSGGERVKLAKDLDADVTGRAVVLTVDIVDRGLTVAYIRRLLTDRGARSVDVCALLDRRSQRLLPVELRYVGRVIGDEYVVGYGLDVAEKYRNLPDIHIVAPRSEPERPDGATSD